MEFQNSGLPNNKVVEEAFNYLRAHTQSHRAEVEKNTAAQIDGQFALYNQQLDMSRAQMGDALYEENKKKLEQQRQAMLQNKLPSLTDQVLEANLKRTIAGALEIQNNSENPSPEMVAAILLLNCVRSPRDFLDVSDKFGRGVADLLADNLHIRSYPAEREAQLLNAGVDAKRLLQALNALELTQLVTNIEQLARVRPGQQPRLGPGFEESMYASIKQLYGNDKKLDARIVDAFNRVAQAVASPYHLEASAGKLELIKAAAPATPAPQPRKPTKDDDDLGIG